MDIFNSVEEKYDEKYDSLLGSIRSLYKIEAF